MTIQQHASFDSSAAELNATSNTNPAVSKMVKLWESKNAQRALKGSGLTLMAMSLTACGSDSDTAAVVTPVTPTTPVAEAVALTIGVDAVTTGAGDDTIDASPVANDNGGSLNTLDVFTALDTIDGGDGADTMNVVQIAAFTVPTGATVTGVEL